MTTVLFVVTWILSGVLPLVVAHRFGFNDYKDITLFILLIAAVIGPICLTIAVGALLNYLIELFKELCIKADNVVVVRGKVK